jgi:uncharacterized protein (TIGR01777 family)
MNVLVSGSHGMIGTALTERLRSDGHTVVRLIRSNEPEPEPAARTAGGVPWDPAAGWIDVGSLQREGPIDAVVNLAGASIGDRRWTPARRRLIESSRRLPTRLLADTVARLDPQPAVIVSASAVGIYGDRGDEPLTEASPDGTGFLADVCRVWEAAMGPAVQAGIRVVHLRSGLVLASTGGLMARLVPIFRLGLGGRLGSGRQFVSWITLEDEVGVLLRAIEDDRVTGPVNATAPRPVTNGEFTRALGRALRRPTPIPLPRQLIEVALGRDLAAELLLSSQRVVPEKLLSLSHTFRTTEIGDAMRMAVGPRR